MDNTHKFDLISKFKPTGDQPKAIAELVKGLEENKKYQVLLGATGTGKTFTIANVINQVQRPTLIIVHNKVLAGQLYCEFKQLFPNNRVEYFVSNFDFYQPEAYIAASDIYIDKNAIVNGEIEMMRTAAINSIIERRDTIIISSVAAIFGLTDPDEYRRLVFDVRVGDVIDRNTMFEKLVESSYRRDQIDLLPGTFRVNGDTIIIFPASYESNTVIRIDTFGDEVDGIYTCDSVSGQIIQSHKSYPIFPAYDHANTIKRTKEATESIRVELEARLEELRSQKKYVEAERLQLRTEQDIESMLEFGFCPGIENYSAHIDKRKPGERPYCLIDYFPKDYLLIIDESHETFPQFHSMFSGDRQRKKNLVEYGFRLPSALDNRPLNFPELEELFNQVICTSATPGPFEMNRTKNQYVEQIIRPTGLLDPVIEVRTCINQVDDIVAEIKKRVDVNERVFIVALSIDMAVDLTAYLKERDILAACITHETKTLERSKLIYQLRTGAIDVLVGVNLLREGLDVPEVSLICILDADKDGFLRTETALIQMIGRAARNAHGKVIMYGEEISISMGRAIAETDRRRAIQEKYNQDNGIVPTTVVKPISSPIRNTDDDIKGAMKRARQGSFTQIKQRIKELEQEMHKAAREFDFSKAAEIRDLVLELKTRLQKIR